MGKNVFKALLVLMLFVMGMPVTLMGKNPGNGRLRVLVAYYSKGGHTQAMAEYIARYTGGDLLRIEPAVPYSQNADSFELRAKTEFHKNIRIELKLPEVRMEDYDVVFIGSPVWFGDWAAPAASFARDERLAGKRVIPFMTSGREESGVLDLLYKKYVNAEVEKGLCLIEDKVEKGGHREVLSWVCNLFSIANYGELTSMNVLASLKEMKCRYPKITLCDVYKSFYQDYFGAGHIIESKGRAKKYIKDELKMVDSMTVGKKMDCKGMFAEATGMEKCGALGRYVRVDLWKIKNGEINTKGYVNDLMQSVEVKVDTAGWLKEWNFILSIMKEYNFKVDNFTEDLTLISTRLAEGKYGMHHSKVFNECYHPHYRIIRRDLLKP
ncbi:MAG: hypothetical protein MJ002_01310 [Paludibacteraceae bacterium]|nr:hypothetical protein [Paludibacteraceae bacterium]